jgi:hypothetical protein
MALTRPVAPDGNPTDERWLLVQRIVSNAAFQKSARVRDLLLFVSERTIHGHGGELTEQQIGTELFHKPHDYSPLEDSTVRVHMRQLRLKLHEYFDEEGRGEPLILSIPKGSYAPIFKPATKPELTFPDPHSPEPQRTTSPWNTVLPWAACAILAAIACASLVLAYRAPNSVGATGSTMVWPISQLIDSKHATIIVVADSNYGMVRILTSQRGSLDQYLRRDFFPDAKGAKETLADGRLEQYISGSTLTSFADVVDVVTLLKMAGPLQKRISVRFPRDLAMRDLDHDNLVFIGSPGSNPWVSLFQNKLNFQESEGIVGNSAKAFVNTRPLPGEQTRYEGLRWTGSVGEDYATIAVLPNPTDDGSILVLQGLQQEGTEAAGRFLADEDSRRQLKTGLGLSPTADPSENVWFEALIHSRTVAGAPNSTSLVAVRRIH